MGYLSSCKSESAVLISNNNNNNKKKKKIEEFRYRDLEAATNGFSDHKLLGKGSHGLVYKAVLCNGRQVAVKIPTHHHKQQQQQQQANSPRRTEVENEIEILSKIRNPRLVNLLGFTTEEEEEDPTTTLAYHRQRQRQRLLVVEFMSNGTLYQVPHLFRRFTSGDFIILDRGNDTNNEIHDFRVYGIK